MTHKNPADVFFWSDWENDPELRSCSLAAQGLWMRFLCIAARSTDRGLVSVRGQPEFGDDLVRALARQVGHAADVIAPLIEELVSTGAASRDNQGRIYCRRMRRAAALSEKRAVSGKAGAAMKWARLATRMAQAYQIDSKVPAKASAKQLAKPPPSSILQSSNLQNNNTQQRPKRGAAREALSEGFEEWYAKYWLHKAKDRARKAYAQALRHGATPERIMAALERDLPEMMAKEPQFRPYPATWLNDGRWRDEDHARKPNGSEQTVKRKFAWAEPDLPSQAQPREPAKKANPELE